MKIENTEAQMRKGILDYCILLVIARGDSYTPAIIASLKRAGMVVVEGTVYPLLTRLKNAGWVNYKWIESPQGPPRKYYAITEPGQLYLQQLNLTWEGIVQSLDAIKNDR